MNETALRAAAEKRRKQLKRLNEGRISDGIWGYLKDKGIVEDALISFDFDDAAIEHIGDEIDKLLAAADPNGDGKRIRRDEDYSGGAYRRERGDIGEQTFSVDLSDYERERSRAYAEVMARLVSQTREVVDFRRDYLGGEVLAPEQAYFLIESSAAGYFPPQLFDEWDVPVVSHQMEVLAETYSSPLDPEIDYSATLRVSPPGITKTVRYAAIGTAAPDDRKADERWSITTGAHRKVEPLQALFYRGRDGLRETAYVWPGSVLDELRILSEGLAESYEWKEEDVVWLFLTGEAPKPMALGMKVRLGRGGTRIDMIVEPWVSVETVEKNYRKIQEQVLTKGNHALSLRRIAVLRFVEAAIRAEGNRPTWSHLLARWNEQHPNWRYADYRGFAQASRETLKQVANYPVRIPNLKSSHAAKKRSEKILEAAHRVAKTDARRREKLRRLYREGKLPEWQVAQLKKEGLISEEDS